MLQKVRAIFRSKGYMLNTRPGELNIVGIRSESTEANRFDDEIHVFFKTGMLKWEYHIYKATTDPGTYWLKNPMQEQGTAILAEGQYPLAYQLGLHRGQYEALVQRRPVSILRDYDRNAVLDFLNGHPESGMCGINIHRANAVGETKSVDKYSAGCQVFENADDFHVFIDLCHKHRDLYGNQFTYTLIDFRAIKRRSKRNAALAVGVITLGTAAGTYIFYE